MASAFSDFDCQICLEPLSRLERSPRLLICKHTFCSTCVCELIRLKQNCPNCRKEIIYRSINEVPINSILLEKIDAQIEVNELKKCNCDEVDLKYCSDCRMWLCNQCAIKNHNTIRCRIVDSSKAQVTFGKSLYELHKILDLNLDSLNKLLDKEIKSYEDQVTHCKSEIDRLYHMMQKANEEAHKLQQVQDMNLKTRNAMKLMASTQKVGGPIDYEKRKAGIKKIFNMTKKYQIKDTPMQNIYKFIEINGVKYWSKVRYSMGKIYISALNSALPPKDALFIPYDEDDFDVNNNYDIFFTISFSDAEVGTVTMSMIHRNINTSHSRNFYKLITGAKMGISYASTLLFDAWSTDTGYGGLKGGDYEYGNGSGGKAVVPLIHRENIPLELTEGDVRAVSETSRTFSQFYIETKCPKGQLRTDPLIARVKQGLDTLKVCQSKLERGLEVYITDCGIIKTT